MYLQRLWIEDDEISRELEQSPWTMVEIVSCQGSKMGNLVETALRQKSVKKFVLRKIASRLEVCIRAIQLSGFQFLTELTLEVALSERASRYLASALDSGNAMGDSSTCSILHLKLERCSFLIPAALTVFARGLKYNSSLKSLSLTRCKLRDDDLQVLIPNLPSSLQSLDLTDNFCRIQLSPLIAAASKLQSLNLTNQHPGEFGGSLDLWEVGRDLSINHALTNLDLSFNMLALTDIHGLIDALESNVTLHTLNLKSNQLDDAAIQYIGERLPDMKGLRRLNITANRFGDHGADALYMGLKQNCIMTHLELPRGFAAEDDINYMLTLNLGGRRLLKFPTTTTTTSGSSADEPPCENTPQIPLGVWPMVFQRVNHLDLDEMSDATRASVIFFLLQEGPILIGQEILDKDRMFQN
ncbi:MAG: hypothetical protein SGARI_001241 [Bacillariaceae sp.]